MNRFANKRIFTATMLVVTLLSFQLSMMAAAHADPTGVDVGVVTHLGMANKGLSNDVCNNGVDGDPTVTQFVLHYETTNFTIDQSIVYYLGSDTGGPATDKGAYDAETGIWTGVLEPDQCVTIGFVGENPGEIGSTSTATFSLVSSQTTGGVTNDDPDSSNDTTVVDPFEKYEDNNIAMEAHLATTGAIDDSTNLTYDINLNVGGPGPYHYAGFLLGVLVIPDGATFVSGADADPDDAVSLQGDACFSPGTADTIAAQFGMPSLGQLHGQIVVCQLETNEAELPSGSTYPLSVTVTAGSSFNAGTAGILGILEGDDMDTLALMVALSNNTPIQNLLDEGNDNFYFLEYDPDSLHATAALCAGQNDTTTDGTGCFRVTFNKKIWAPSFTTSMIDLGGVGSITGFTQIDDFTWEVHVGGIQWGQTLTLNLKDNNSVQDYSAVVSQVQVLGENTIRFSADDPASDSDSSSNDSSSSSNGSVAGTTSAHGVLSSTGVNADWKTPVVLIVFGLILLGFATRRRKVTA